MVVFSRGGGVGGRRRSNVIPWPHRRDTRHASLLCDDLFHMDLGTVSVCLHVLIPKACSRAPAQSERTQGKEGNCAEDPRKSSPGKTAPSSVSTCQIDRRFHETHIHIGFNTLRTLLEITSIMGL